MPHTRPARRRSGALCALLLAPLLVLLTAVPGTAAPPRRAPVAETDRGPVRGRAHGSYDTFEGIPFAAPPTGRLRWHDPVPARPWHGIRDAGAPGPRCAQAAQDTGAATGSEDCLYLNVTAPARARGRGLPVMVWLHGGDFVFGSGDVYRAQRLAVRGDAVVVTVNYRLGVFGFFAHPALAGTGFGLADQQAALRWVRANARHFGGDPHRVTLFGESAGAISVCAHLVSPRAAGLFRRAVLESGSCTTSMPANGPTPGLPAWSPWVPLRDARSEGADAARRLGCTHPDRALRCLRALPAGKLATAGLMQSFSFVPYGTGLLPLRPDRALEQGRFHRVPVVQGTNHDEMRYFVAASFAAHPVHDERGYRARLRDSFGTAAGAVEARYPAARYPTPALAWAAVLTDRSFACTTLRADRALAARVPVYGYEFSDPDAPNAFGLPTVQEVPYGAAHAFELPYLFVLPAAFTPAQRTLSARMTDAWTRFAHTSAPGSHWPRFRAKAPLVQSLAPGPEGIRPVDPGREHHCTFWDRHGA